jgi:alpha-mannosidase
VASYAMENEFLSIDFDRATGGIIKLIDKKTGKNLASPEKPLGVLEYVLERADVMSSWVVHEAQQRCNMELVSLKKPQCGPHMSSVVAKGKIKDSTFEITYSLKAGEPKLDIDVKIVWVERGGPQIGTPSLLMKFPLALDEAKGRYEIPFGSIERDLNHGEEVPSQKWLDITGKQGQKSAAGCAILNDSKYGYSLTDSTLRVSLIRSSYEPDMLPEIGEHAIRLAVAPHGDSLSVSDLTRLGAAFNHPLEVIGTDIHKGNFTATSDALVACKQDNVLIVALKKAEDSDDIILHLLETAGRATTAEVKLGDNVFGTIAEAVEVDFIERPIENSSAKKSKNGFSVKLPANGITAVKVHLM